MTADQLEKDLCVKLINVDLLKYRFDHFELRIDRVSHSPMVLSSGTYPFIRELVRKVFGISERLIVQLADAILECNLRDVAQVFCSCVGHVRQLMPPSRRTASID